MPANIEQVSAAHRASYRATDARPDEWAAHVEACPACDTLEHDAARGHRFVNAYLLAYPTTSPVEVGDILAHFEHDITANHYDPDGDFWRAIADYFIERITEPHVSDSGRIDG